MVTLIINILTKAQKVLTIPEPSLSMRVLGVLLTDFPNLYIIRIKQTGKTPETLANKGYQAISKLKRQWHFLVFYHNFNAGISRENPLLTGLSAVTHKQGWLKHWKIFTCDCFASCFSVVKKLHAGMLPGQDHGIMEFLRDGGGCKNAFFTTT